MRKIVFTLLSDPVDKKDPDHQQCKHRDQLLVIKAEKNGSQDC